MSTRHVMAVESGWIGSLILIPRSSGVRVLRYADGTRRIEHTCKGWTEDDGTVVAKVCAPALSDRHTVTSETPLTVVPSILCPDCGLHGFITDGRWADV